MTTALVISKSNEIQASANCFNADMVERWLRFARVSPKSQQTYWTAIKQLFNYFRANEISQPTRDDIVMWVDSLAAAGKSAATVNLYVTACRKFFSFLSDDAGIYPNVAARVKSGLKISSAHKRDALTKQQAKDLLKSVKGNDEKALRDRAILGLLVSCGLRTIEIVRADVEDLRGGFLRIQGKGHSEKDSLVRVPEQVEKLIRIYLAKRQARKGEPLFTSTSNNSKGGRLSTQTIRFFVKACLRSIGLDDERLSAHSLRHTAATLALIEGESVENVQMMLRHKSISTTQIYRHDLDRLNNFAENRVANCIFA